MSIVEFANRAVSGFSDDWSKVQAYRCHVCITEDHGQYTAIVLNLPGTGSFGDSMDEALKNVREAALGVIESHREANEEVPWTESDMDGVPESAQLKWIIVNA